MMFVFNIFYLIVLTIYLNKKLIYNKFKLSYLKYKK